MHGVDVGVGEDVAAFWRSVEPEAEAEAVTVVVLRSIPQSLWHVGQGPSVVIVVVVGQDASLGGTKSVVVDTSLHCGMGPHLRVGQSVLRSDTNNSGRKVYRGNQSLVHIQRF